MEGTVNNKLSAAAGLNEENIKNPLVMSFYELLVEHKGEDTVVIDVTGECSWTDFFIITTVRSQAHMGGVLRHLYDFLKREKSMPMNKHKNARGEGWLLLDCGDIIVHLMEKESRDFYELEKLWFKGKIYSQPQN